MEGSVVGPVTGWGAGGEGLLCGRPKPSAQRVPSTLFAQG